MFLEQLGMYMDGTILLSLTSHSDYLKRDLKQGVDALKWFLGFQMPYYYTFLLK